jgi:hypothetical protein
MSSGILNRRREEGKRCFDSFERKIEKANGIKKKRRAKNQNRVLLWWWWFRNF